MTDRVLFLTFWGECTGVLLSPKVGKIEAIGCSREDILSLFLAGINLETVPRSTMTNVLGSNHLYIDPNKEYLFWDWHLTTLSAPQKKKTKKNKSGGSYWK